MRKLMVSSAVMATLSLAAINANAASTGTITFNGELTATTCNVSVDGQTADATVTLPTIGTNQLANPGETAGRTGFNMALSDCEGTLETASAYFESGDTVDLATGRLKNSGTATNVSLQLLDGSNSSAPIKAGNSTQVDDTEYVSISTGTANLPYHVQYFADAATGPGLVKSSVVYSIQYK